MWGKLVVFLGCVLAVKPTVRLRHNGNIYRSQADAIFITAERALNFMVKNHETLNLDGAVGARIMQGVYEQLIKTYGLSLPEKVVRKMKQVEELAGIAGDLGTMTAALRTPFYFSRAGFLLRPELWRFFLPSRRFKTLPTVDIGSLSDSDNLEEEPSDLCLREFIPHNLHPRCGISKKCFNAMTTSNYSSYSLTHQLLYFLVGIGAHCERELTDLMEGPPSTKQIEQHMSGFCARIDSEARTLEDQDFPTEFRDLFMEQVGLCGIAGFTQIARLRWLDHIVSWQSATTGCYHRFDGENLNPENFDPSHYGNYRRRRRSESIMQSENDEDDVCLSHRTAVALLALSAYTRRLVEEVVMKGVA
ncbi:unnamed protein product [Mesocestoides corti]|uniref:UPF0764 protein C16orf89 homolog n=1 Tax=Mesocestoides corti TaxID=53468 RepID=A0A0R3UIC8_MESCO|nr:unnamed protein product [Mesocestoides corti]